MQSSVNDLSVHELEMSKLIEDLFPICRSITGDGVRRTLEAIDRHLPLDMHEIPSGTQAFDWTVPDEWTIRDAYIESLDGDRIVEFSDSNLHVLNYSEGIDAEVSGQTLQEHLFSIPDHPDWIPYRTSYYKRNWGFCVPHRLREELTDDAYRVFIDADLEPGSLTYAECVIPGTSSQEFVLFTHVCHPSLCNDNLTGIAVLTSLGRLLKRHDSLRLTYRLVFAPGTIGSIVWLSQNQDRLKKIEHGLVLGLLGDNSPHTYKRTRSGSANIDYLAEHVLQARDPATRFLDYSPYGYDERQFGSPGIDLPFGRLTRSVNGGYPEYHSSADNLDIVSDDRLRDSLEAVSAIVAVAESDRKYINLSPHCEPQLGRRGLYRQTGGSNVADRESAMLWLLNQSDGDTSLRSIARKSGLSLDDLESCADALCEAGLLQALNTEAGDQG